MEALPGIEFWNFQPSNWDGETKVINSSYCYQVSSLDWKLSLFQRE